MLSRGPDVEIEPYYCLPVGTVSSAGAGGHHHHHNGMVPWSQPTSPTPPARGFAGLLSPTHTPGSSSISTASHRLTYPKKNDEGECCYLPLGECIFIAMPTLGRTRGVKFCYLNDFSFLFFQFMAVRRPCCPAGRLCTGRRRSGKRRRCGGSSWNWRPPGTR